MLVLLLIAALLTVAARVLGSTQPPNPALVGFTLGCENQPQPCWYGIVPGMTNVEEASQIIENLGYGMERDENYRLFHAELRLPHYITLYGDPATQNLTRLVLDYYYAKDAVEVGAITALFGTPHSVIYTPDPVGLGFAYDYLYFGNDGDFPLQTSIRFIGLRASRIPNNSQLSTPWRGYAPRWRYCQLDPDFIFCNY